MAHLPSSVCFTKAAERLFVWIIKARVHGIEVLAIHVLLNHPQRLAETLEVGNLPLAQKFNRLPYVGNIHQTQDIVVGCTSFLLCRNPIRTTF